MSRSTWKYNPETREVECVADDGSLAVEWLHTGVRFGRDLLDKFRREGLVPMDDYKETWAKAEKERERIRGLRAETPEQKLARRRDVQEAIQKLNAGYRPHRPIMEED